MLVSHKYIIHCYCHFSVICMYRQACDGEACLLHLRRLVSHIERYWIFSGITVQVQVGLHTALSSCGESAR